MERRQFLKLSAFAAAASSIDRALALPADHTTGTIQDVQHIVVLMQENRSFDHYFGTLRGVRGFNDRFPVRLPGGNIVWHQPRQKHPGSTLLPFHLDTSRTSAQAVADLDHTWPKTQAALNGGRHDSWPAYKTDLTMGHYTRADIPFHFALAEAFTICDQYFCSLPGPTHPNRMYLMTGTIDPFGTGGGPLLDNADVVDDPTLKPFSWTTYPERLDKAGINWQVYQQGLDWKDPFNGNYGLNVLQNFQQFIDAKPGSSLRDRGYAVRTLDQFAGDAKTGKLPQVSWLMPPAAFSEHPKYMPAYGATYIAEVLDALTANPDVWSKTVLLVMYDENDGYFDHMVPPQPPTPALPGESTVSTAGEIHDRNNPAHKPFYPVENLPYGLGPRVPMFAISPWSKGGFVNSQLFDHTSVIRFIEARFGVHEPNISPWRREVCGDLTTAFDFSRPSSTLSPLVSTADYRAKADQAVKTLPDAQPPASTTSLAKQEPGTRPARPLPYALDLDLNPTGSDQVSLAFTNRGAQGASFTAYHEGTDTQPWRFTVGAGHELNSVMLGAPTRLVVQGPNGFHRAFAGGKSPLVVKARGEGDALTLTMLNHGKTPLTLQLTDSTYNRTALQLVLGAGEQHVTSWPIAASSHWYDVTLSSGGVEWRFAGHVETGKVSISDPAALNPLV